MNVYKSLADIILDKKNKARELLEEAIEMHQMHLDDPSTATKESQKELMKLLKNALLEL